MTVHAPLLEDVAPQPEPAQTPSGAQPWPKPADAWRTLWVLSLVLGLSQIDRGVLSLLVTPIKQDLRLSDSQVGLLIGLAFSLVYLFLSFPLSRISDTRSRKVMIALGVAFWSISTALCGLAQNFWQMFFARAGVGAGEAVNGPATYALLADSFPRDKLPRAMAILNVGFMAGTAVSLIAGALVIGALVHVQLHGPVLGQLKSWQLVFMAVGLPGLLVALLMLTVTEPARRGVGGKPAGGTVPIREVFAFLMRNGRLYGCMFGSVFINGVVIYGAQSFRPAFFWRTYHWPAQQMGLSTGFATLVASPFGLMAGTWLCERWNRKRHDGSMRVAVLANALATPFAVAGSLMPTPWLSVGCAAASAAFIAMATPALVSAMQTVTPNNIRAQVNSIYLLLFSGVTGILGPWVVGQITDMLHDPSKLGLVLAATAAVGSPIALLCLWFAIKPFGQAIQVIEAGEAGAAG
jgi:MFS family permease